MEGIVTCPHCKDPVIISQLNCRIFRHGAYRHNGAQINPHETKEECRRLSENSLIFGCGGPFYVKGDSATDIIAEVCDYI
jgi:hypothetical protein